MKKNLVLMMLTLLLVVACTGPISAFAAAPDPQPNASILADKFIYYHKIVDGKKYYRIWNATDLRWETPWLPC